MGQASASVLSGWLAVVGEGELETASVDDDSPELRDEIARPDSCQTG
jgi:hypothetical protein